MESEVNKWDPPNPFETSQALKGGDVTHKNEKGYLEDISKKKLFKAEIIRSWKTTREFLMPQLGGERSRVEIMIWLLVYSGLAYSMARQSIQLYQEYQTQQPYVVVSMDSQYPTQFPSISVCNKNVISAFNAVKYAELNSLYGVEQNLASRVASGVNALRSRGDFEAGFALENLCISLVCPIQNSSWEDESHLCIPNEWLCDGFNDCLLDSEAGTSWDETEYMCAVREAANFSQVFNMSRPLSLECALGFIACTEYTCVPICDYRHKPECVYGDIPESLMSAINCSNWSKEDLYTRRSQQDWIFDLVRGRVEKSAIERLRRQRRQVTKGVEDPNWASLGNQDWRKIYMDTLEGNMTMDKIPTGNRYSGRYELGPDVHSRPELGGVRGGVHVQHRLLQPIELPRKHQCHIREESSKN
ncbi:uncharacterized protein LOC134839646 isoform X2 [Symsagittifera roscoffensis]|uniref:uncharacterized protein LOC134839646 isoform X2 n=1 Tax=Symsagittifera roscoffensis TaxID=84072 RepID=UPI00307BA271